MTWVDGLSLLCALEIRMCRMLGDEVFDVKKLQSLTNIINGYDLCIALFTIKRQKRGPNSCRMDQCVGVHSPSHSCDTAGYAKFWMHTFKADSTLQYVPLTITQCKWLMKLRFMTLKDKCKSCQNNPFANRDSVAAILVVVDPTCMQTFRMQPM